MIRWELWPVGLLFSGRSRMPSVSGLLEERELAARRRVEEADRVQAALVVAEQDWSEWVIARSRVGEVLALGGAGDAAPDSTGGLRETGPQTEAAKPKSVVPVWRSTRAAVRSPVSAAVTIMPSSRPSVSTTACRLRPLISLPPSNPRLSAPTTASAFTDWESITPAVGSGSRPAFSRTFPRSRSWNSTIRLCSRQRRKKA